MGEEFGTGRKNLPPTKLVLIILGVALVVVGIVAFVLRPQASATGSIDAMDSVEVVGQNSMMVAITLTLQGDTKTSYKMRSVSAELDTGKDTYEDEPASAVDFDRYFQGFPVLKSHAVGPLKIQNIEAGGQNKGTIIVTFPVTPDVFANRKSLKVKISAYGEPEPLVLVK
jgi:hypothetical protein